MKTNELTEKEKMDAFIDANGKGTTYYAIEACKATISRRLADGKSSPVAESMLANLLELPFDYQTQKQADSSASSAEYIRNTQGVD